LGMAACGYRNSAGEGGRDARRRKPKRKSSLQREQRRRRVSGEAKEDETSNKMAAKRNCGVRA
jgi:hypothetical protein